MPSFNNYLYQTPFGFQLCRVGVDAEPLDWSERWGVNLDEAELIAEDGATPSIVDGDVVVEAD